MHTQEQLLAGLRIEDTGVPIYVQLREQFLRMMGAGRLKPGDQMPTMRQVAVSLRVDGGGAQLEVQDDGAGLPPDWKDKARQDGGHYGLRWLAERVEALGGRLAIANRAVRGAQLQVWLPFTTAEEGSS